MNGILIVVSWTLAAVFVIFACFGFRRYGWRGSKEDNNLFKAWGWLGLANASFCFPAVAALLCWWFSLPGLEGVDLTALPMVVGSRLLILLLVLYLGVIVPAGGIFSFSNIQEQLEQDGASAGLFAGSAVLIPVFVAIAACNQFA